MQRALNLVTQWLERIDPGTHRRIKGLRLVTAYGIALALGTLRDLATLVPAGLSLGALAGSFALWASVSEARTTRYESSRDLVALCFAAAVGATLFASLAPLTFAAHVPGLAGSEWILITGAFAVGAFKRYGVLGAGIGSQIYIGELTAYTLKASTADCQAIVVAAAIACISAIAAAPAKRSRGEARVDGRPRDRTGQTIGRLSGRIRHGSASGERSVSDRRAQQRVPPD
ncbi:membrane protein of unknown function [Pararobbsia alpina]|uniref:hypothetical protein n=1 Tax=Pararobbsia alpina TaxID=621374 RepID=UPI0039A6E5C6